MPDDNKEFPGIYIEEVRVRGAITAVETALPVFIGYTAKATKDRRRLELFKPYKIHNIIEFENIFGGPELEKNIVVNVIQQRVNGLIKIKSAVAEFKTGKGPSLHNMYYAVKLFFDNGGRSCFIIPVGKTAGAKQIQITALEMGLKAIEDAEGPTITIFPEGQGIVNSEEYYSLIQKAIEQASRLRDRFVIFDLHKQYASTAETVSNFRSKFISSKHPEFGAAYYPNLNTVYKYNYNDKDVAIIISTDGIVTFKEKLSFLNLGPTKDLAAYTAARDAINKMIVTVPASAAVAGAYCQTDLINGVWKSPSNIALKSVTDTSDVITQLEQEQMNVDPVEGKSVNAIRSFVGRGVLIYGGRTLNGNSPEWKYINVRRFCTMVERSIEKGIAENVFKPNDAQTWITTRATIENFLSGLWRQGALLGSKQEHGFFVRCGLNQTMTAQDILEGRLKVEVGLAVIRPAEFIILHFTQHIQSS